MCLCVIANQPPIRAHQLPRPCRVNARTSLRRSSKGLRRALMMKGDMALMARTSVSSGVDT